MNPKEIVMNMMRQQLNNNPMVNNLVQMAKQGDSKGVENFARNFLNERGRDFDKEFGDFMSQMKKR